MCNFLSSLSLKAATTFMNVWILSSFLHPVLSVWEEAFIWCMLGSLLVTDTDAAGCGIFPAGRWATKASVDLPSILSFVLHLCHPGLSWTHFCLCFSSNHQMDIICLGFCQDTLFPIYMKNSLRGGCWWWLPLTGAFGKWVYRGNIYIQHSKCTCNIPASYFANHLPSTKGENRQVGKHSHTGRDGDWLPCSYLHFSDTIPSTHSPQAHNFKNKFKAKSRWIRQTEPLFFFFLPSSLPLLLQCKSVVCFLYHKNPKWNCRSSTTSVKKTCVSMSLSLTLPQSLEDKTFRTWGL